MKNHKVNKSKSNMFEPVHPNKKNMLLAAIGFGILLPLFFRFSGGIYRDSLPTVDSHGVLATLPLPISIWTCLIALIILAPSNLPRARPAILMIGGTLLVSFISLWLGADLTTPSQRKTIVILQVMLPMAGLLLGQMVDDKGNVIARVFLIMVLTVVPLQLFASWLQGQVILTSYLYAFSIYSHFQYVTLIFVCAFAYSLSYLWNEHRVWIFVAAGPMLIYVLASLSFLTIFAYFSLWIAVAVCALRAKHANIKLVVTWVILIAMIAMIALGAVVYGLKKNEQHISAQIGSNVLDGKFNSLGNGKIPINVQERFGDWKLFGAGIVESKKTLMVGHPQPMSREIRSSPHNWYVDVAYTFGFVGLLPIFSLIGYTVYLCWRGRHALAGKTWWLAAIVFYLVIVDSNFKVTLRQPYPGIFAYFLWGLLLSRLRPFMVSKADA